MKNYNVLFWFGVARFSLCETIQVNGQENCTSFNLDYICQNSEYVQAVSLDCGIACLNADGVAGASDLLIFLSEFGLGCN